ncbi:MAG: RNA methyltransferase [Planctomycetaceae bacterium]|nr:RNA methyltransferase [Planctomycetaceae bacterium]
MPVPLSEFLKQFLLEDRLQRFEEVARQRTRHLTIVLENIFHAHNASACLRTCDCFGIQDVHIVEDRNRFEPNKDIALGASQWLTIHRYQQVEATESLPDADAAVDADTMPAAAASRPHTSASPSATRCCIQTLQQQGYHVLATSPRQHSVPLQEIDVTRPTALIFGAEQVGVSDEAIALADQLVHIPMYGFTESFNISVSAALCLQHLTTRLRQTQVSWQLSEQAHDEILDEWVRNSLGSKLTPLLRRYEQDHQN